MTTMLRKLGAPTRELDELTNASMPVRPLVGVVEPTVLIDDRERLAVPGWDLTAVWTPGHSPGHLCFWEDRHRLMLTGDCVLPRITPNVNLNPQTEPDPLGDYLDSLEKLAAFDAVEALPAHEWRFVGHRERLREIRAHHEHRFEEVIAAVRAGYDTAWEVAPRMEWSRPWDQTDGFMRRSAIGEAYAHLARVEQAWRARGDRRRAVTLAAPRGLNRYLRFLRFPKRRFGVENSCRMSGAAELTMSSAASSSAATSSPSGSTSGFAYPSDSEPTCHPASNIRRS